MSLTQQLLFVFFLVVSLATAVVYGSALSRILDEGSEGNLILEFSSDDPVNNSVKKIYDLKNHSSTPSPTTTTNSNSPSTTGKPKARWLIAVASNTVLSDEPSS